MKKPVQRAGGTLRRIFIPQTILIIVFSLLLSAAGVVLNINTEADKRDLNLTNMAEAVAQSGIVRAGESTDSLKAYLDALKSSISSIDVLSVIGRDGVRLYHTNHALIGTVYDGTVPVFDGNAAYTSSDSGPSGEQRRAYAPVYDESGSPAGFVLAVMLNSNIRAETFRMLLTYLMITVLVIVAEMLLSLSISKGIRDRLYGYEPDAFSAMFDTRENILESLKEGIVAADSNGTVQYMNPAAQHMIGSEPDSSVLAPALETGEKQMGAYINGDDGAVIVIDRLPITKNGTLTGAVGILHDRTEYTRMAEDLAGTRFLVDSMRANNHDFINKLHVILGLLEMEMYDEARNYISNITFVQRELISSVMRAIDEPALAALIIGKIARAAELNIRFTLQENTCLRRSDIRVSSDTLVTVTGNLIQNAFEAMSGQPASKPAELSFGVWTKPGSLIMNVTDTGSGIPDDIAPRVFDRGFTTKGEGHGTGLYCIKSMLEAQGGSISFKTVPGKGTSFNVRLDSAKGDA